MIRITDMQSFASCLSSDYYCILNKLAGVSIVHGVSRVTTSCQMSFLHNALALTDFVLCLRKTQLS